MITLDAGVLVAHLRPADPHHAAAHTLLVDAADERLIIHPLNLAEVLVGGVRVGRGAEMLADLETLGVQAVEPTHDEPLQLATLRAESGLKLPDCCALHTALTPGSALATFDTALAAAARRRHVEVLSG